MRINATSNPWVVGVALLTIEFAAMVALIIAANQTDSATSQSVLRVAAGLCIIAAGLTTNLTARSRRRQTKSRE
jgi:hypothetical protein